MKNFNKGDRFGGKKRFDSDRGFRSGGGSGRPEMHKAICADCGKACEVPFKPSGDKPVFCSDCFGKKDGGGNNRFDRRDSARPSFGGKPMFKAVCAKCHKACEVPFRPSGDKPIFCSDCFGKGERGEKSGSGSNLVSSDKCQKQFEILNKKLDNIYKILSPKILIEKTAQEEPALNKTEKIVEKKIGVKKVAALKKVAAPKKAGKKVAAKKKK
jgi:CxxC-x17-CxxC domain-containing protein